VPYLVDIASLVCRRFINNIRLQLQNDIHRGLKQSPTWLKTREYRFISKKCLEFPFYESVNLYSECKNLCEWNEDDVESYFYKHRWSTCVLGTLAGGECAIKSIDEVIQWMDDQPPKSDKAWETYSTSERVANLLILLAAYPELQQRINQKKLIEFLEDSVRWIYDHLEYYGLDKTNNHLLNNARALILAGSVLGDKECIENGLTIYSKLTPVLFSNDGFLRERSSHYQLIVATWLFDGLHFAKKIGNIFQLYELEVYAQKIAIACSMIVSVTPKMDLHIGDISPDLTPILTLARLKRLYPDAIREILPSSSQSWKFAVSVNDVVMACIPVKWPLGYADHGHADMGSFVWRSGNTAILVDPGRINYTNNQGTKYQISSKGHNTLEINGLSPLSESLLTNGIWYPKVYSNSHIYIEQPNEALMKVSHNGFQRILGVNEHVREIKLTDSGLKVTDLITGNCSVDVVLMWHFSPDLNPVDNNLIRSDGLLLKIETISNVAAQFEYAWSDYPYSESYGHSKNAYCISVRFTATLPVEVTTHFRILKCAE
jgi:hypothetical protein